MEKPSLPKWKSFQKPKNIGCCLVLGRTEALFVAQPSRGNSGYKIIPHQHIPFTGQSSPERVIGGAHKFAPQDEISSILQLTAASDFGFSTIIILHQNFHTSQDEHNCHSYINHLSHSPPQFLCRIVGSPSLFLSRDQTA